MADLRPDPESDSDTRHERPAATRMPRWVKVFVIVGVLLIALLIATQFIGGGGHGPGRHGGSGETPTSTQDDGHTPPVDHGP